MLRKFFALITTVIIIMSAFVCGFTVHAEEDCTVTVETVTAATGDEVFVHLNIKNNPGIMAMTISITYDPVALEYMDYFYGDVFTDYTVAAHPSRKLIRLVISERKDLYDDGIIVSFQFKVAQNAEFDLHKMTVEYSSGDFCNSDLVRIMPKIVSGGVNVEYNGSNCPHKSFGEWSQTVAPSCEKEGVEQRTCSKCPHTENRPIAPIGHTFSDKWTVDIPATKDVPGMMSRHCIRCSASTDETNFTLEDSEKGDIENKPEAEVPENDVVKDIIEEQHPDIDVNNPDKNNSSNTSQNNNSHNKDSNTDSNNDKENNTDDKTDDKVEDFLGIISPDDDEDNATIAEKLREAIPKIDLIITILKIAIIILIIFVLL